MSKISIIAAVDRRMAIGFENKLLFWLPNDLKRFKALTTGNTIVMGRKTFESLPKGALPNRRNVVLSSNPTAECPGAEVFPSLEAALQSCKEDEHVYIIGGASVYQQALPFADELCLTEIDSTAPEADAFFPDQFLRRYSISVWFKRTQNHFQSWPSYSFRYASSFPSAPSLYMTPR